jgi:ferric-dicitrate binding protein FerR (iron transport regulator)
MEKYRDFTAVDFLNDESFLKWLSEPNKKENEFWNEFLKQHPYKKGEINEATLVFKLFRSHEESLGLDETYELWNRIQRDSKASSKTIFLKFMKYAAIFLLAFILGGISYYFIQNLKQPTYFELAETKPNERNDARIVLADGSEVSLEKAVSQISYSRNGQQLVVNNDTIHQKAGAQKEQMNKVIIPYGKKSMIVLADGTKVWLNAGSQLIYPSAFINKTRQVMLIGEAYFDVAKNPDRPFIVHASDLQVQVLGTRFDISAYPEDKLIQTVLEEGKVNLKYSRKGFLGREYSVEMVPNQKVELDLSTGVAKSLMVNVAKYISWKEGMLEFDKIDLIKALKQVERYYNIKIHLANPMVGLYKLSGKLDLKDEPEEVLNVIKLTVPIDWQKKSNGDFVIVSK